MTKRCEDCVHYSKEINFFGSRFIECVKAEGQPLSFFHTADDCLAYSRKWWKFWKPR